jgi:folate-binding protein YgfZ
MRAVWQFLDALHPTGTWDAQGYWHINQQAQTNEGKQTWFAPLCHYGFVSIAGPDSGKFLQGQTSCDWKNITPSKASRGSYCNIKGRVQCNFLGGMLNENDVLLRMSEDLCDNFCTALAKYIVFSKAKMHNASEQWAAIGVVGPNAAALIANLFGTSPEQPLEAISSDNGMALQLDEQGQRFECWIPAAHIETLWSDLSEAADLRDTKAWEQLNIDAGIGEVCAATADLFLPQMLNMQLTGGVSFKKGCYTGQEVVARMEYRGKLKKRMYHASISDLSGQETEQSATLGAPVYKPGEDKAIGNIVSAVHNQTSLQILAVLNNEAAQAGEVCLSPESNISLTIKPLPYPVPE